jgi:hypothetical protein
MVGAAQGTSARLGRLAGSPVHQPGRRRAIRAGDPDALEGQCIGVFDLESPELDAFTKEHKELLTLLASQAAVAIENARLYEQVRRNEERIEKELRFAQRVQMALLPTGLPRQLDEADVAASFEQRVSWEGTSTTSCCPNRRRWSSPSATYRARARPPLSTARSSRNWCEPGPCAGASRRSAFACPASYRP